MDHGFHLRSSPQREAGKSTRLHTFNRPVMSLLPRTLEPEVMDTVKEAVDYDNMEHTAVNERFATDLADLLVKHRCSPPETILDIGTGTSQIPLQILRAGCHCSTLLACDLSLEMLRIAHQRVRQESRQSIMLPVYCDAKQLPVARHSCDVVISNSIIHHIPEPLSVFAEMRRVLRPGGLLLVRDLLRPQDNDTVEHLVASYTGRENSHQQQLFRQSLHAALTVDEVRDVLSRAKLDPDLVRQTSDRHWTVAGRT